MRRCPVCGLATCWWWELAQDFPKVPVESKPLDFPRQRTRVF